jgi:hypothetical protein
VGAIRSVNHTLTEILELLKLEARNNFELSNFKFQARLTMFRLLCLVFVSVFGSQAPRLLGSSRGAAVGKLLGTMSLPTPIIAQTGPSSL